METVNNVIDAFGRALGRFFVSDNELISEEGKNILSNDQDKKILFDELKRMKEEHLTSSKIKLSKGEDITIVY